MEFEKRKAAAMAALAAPAPDKSPKGGVDAPIVPLLDVLNSHPSYFTTSSCSGRISILAHRRRPSYSDSSAVEDEKKAYSKKKAGGGGWVFVSHDPADPEAVVDLLFGERAQAMEGELVFRFEPLIVAVECREVAAAQALVSTAISCGFRESGITNTQKRVIVAIRCSIRMEVPLGQLDHLLVPAEYVQFLGLPVSPKDMLDYGQGCIQKIGKDGSFKAKTNNFFAASKLDGNKAVEPHLDDGYRSNSGCSERFDEKGTVASCSKLLEESVCSPEVESEIGHSKMIVEHETDSNIDISGTSRCSISVVMLKIFGEPYEKLSLWGQSACVLSSGGKEQVFVFGGFGGLGRHSRQNYSLLLDSQSGLLTEIEVANSPSPRMGHTALLVGSCIFVIGGRAGPLEILNDVWVLKTTKNTWSLLQCNGHFFNLRHRHTAAVIGSKIYIFGGLCNDVIYSSMNILDTQTLTWSEISKLGVWPCARHSHSMVAINSQLFMFGGYDGQKALGDLYSFDIKTLQWKTEKTTGRAPYPRFSHSMFAYKNYLGIIGGCPVRQQHQELSLLNLANNVWVHVTIDSFSRELWVRSSACLVNDELVIIGGGASCYAFGTKFTEPMKINLQLLESICEFLPEAGYQPTIDHNNRNNKKDSTSDYYLQGTSSNLEPTDLSDNFSKGNGNCADYKIYVLQIKKRYAKFAKDVTKKFGFLDLSRKVCPSPDGCDILLPITSDFHSLLLEKQLTQQIGSDGLDHVYQHDESQRNDLSVNEITVSKALNVLLACGISLVTDDVPCNKKLRKSPQKMMKELVRSLLTQKGMSLQLLHQLPTRWEHLGDIVVLPKSAFTDPIWDSIEEEVWPLVAKSLGAQRLARQGRILPTGTRDSTLELLLGDNGWVTHQENGIIYSFDATRCMFSSGNLSEKRRMGALDCADEVIVDLFAGIGYFVLPFLVKAKAKLVYACEWNPHAIKALQHNVHANSVANQCIILEGDNHITAPKGVANRVCLGLLPSSECSWDVAVRALRHEGGILHVHGNVKDCEEDSWLDHVVKSISNIAHSEGLLWDVSIQHLERVKWYAPHIRHLVADVRCKQS
ncbi:tRNA wybutosine-synthesizing protein 2/3/4-like isoform X2 [Zingiber officinale]|uniref:tRNA wybutosine-synthesizing protein 2/3/4-like isoform X2 n=1 Tax=Zingiber officinale TaxID=94328 RepID=UPI001C4D14F3|nr:tRNA wybutosine-synthesizing protein 2/3/4-like isoform X2 [Zingiber officinale]